MAELSICVIARNESACLTRALQSVAPIAHEIVLVDTGSTDDTVDIAARFGARIFGFEWVDDFSQARNYALMQSRGEWILMLDADETIAARDLDRVRTLIDTGTADAYAFVQRTYGANLSHPEYMNRGADDYEESQPFDGWIP